MARLCVNMIVRNESAIIKRCIDSTLPYISAAVIVDTGSTDDTIRIMEETFAAADIPFRIYRREFKNFMQARNEALDLARLSDLDFEAILLTDADMELVVEDETCFDKLPGPSYDIIQKSGTLSYHNRRIVSRFTTGGYKGVTHEYLDVPAAGCLTGVHFVDHACGSNRPDKFARDIALLLEDLERDPANERSWFYLAQSYRDNGQPAQAAQAYRRRIDLGGWAEEVWNARMNYAACLRAMGDEGGFIKETLAAYEFRPTRGETLFDLAKYFREKGNNISSLLCSGVGINIPYPNDALFVNEFVHKFGLREEFSICAFYNPPSRDDGFKVTNGLALDREAPEHSRQLAKNNLYFYMKPLSAWAPSFKAHRLEFDGLPVPYGYVAMNPSIANVEGELMAIVRTVNYVLTGGRYLIRGIGSEATDIFPIDTLNYLVQLNNDLSFLSSEPITWTRPEAKFKPVTGLEDMRLFNNGKRLSFSACVREQNADGRCEQWVGELKPKAGGPGMFVDDEHVMRPEQVHHEKNWMPFGLGDNGWEFVYRLGTTIDEWGKVTHSETPVSYTDTLSGGSQVIPFAGAYLAVVHEARHLANGLRYYQHRFALMDEKGKLGKLSAPFYLHDRQIEFVAGLCWHPDKKRLLLSYGVRDEESWVAEVDWQEVAEMLL